MARASSATAQVATAPGRGRASAILDFKVGEFQPLRGLGRTRNEPIYQILAKSNNTWLSYFRGKIL